MSIRNTEVGTSASGPAGLADTLAPEDSPKAAGAIPGSAFAQTNPMLGATLPPEELPGAGSAAQLTSDSIGSGAAVSVVSVRSEFPVTNWERYEFLALLGQGGMGAVYKARDKRLGRIVALKFIRSGDDRMVMRFQQEARAQARIDHPHVCKVYEVGEVDGKTYIAMQFVDGQSLDRGYVTLSLTQKVVVMRQVAQAMHEAHRLGIIHRGLIPPSRNAPRFSVAV